MRRLSLVLLFLFAISGLALAAPPNCDPHALEQAVAACGMDIGCITQATAEYNAACMGGSGSGGMGGMGGDVMARMMACGGDPDCQRRVMEEVQQEFEESGPDSEDGDFDTTRRLSERTVLAPSWLQSYQEALVVCAADVACWTGQMAAAHAHIQASCGTNFMSEATIICQLSARYEIHIEQAIAQQRLWRKGVRFEGDAPGAAPPGDSPRTPAPAATREAPALPVDAALSFLPEVSPQRLRTILSTWEGRLEDGLPGDALDPIRAGAAAVPEEGEEGLPPLIYEEVEGPDGLEVQARATSRDWYYALTAVLLTHAGLTEGGVKGRQILDVSFWCMIQAAKLDENADHLSGVGFHLNLLGKVEDARDVLAAARALGPDQPDVHNNLAFSYAALGQDQEALALQRYAARLDPGDTHIRSRLDALEARAPGGTGSETMPYGGDFGEAFFRLGKRHSLREYWAGKEWFKANQTAKNGAFGGTPLVVGPNHWYQEQLQDIAADLYACGQGAPQELKGCPFGAGIIHPSCANAASAQQVARSVHNRKVALCECGAKALMDRADALSAYLDRAVAVWQTHEEAWLPRLRQLRETWSAEIKQLNQRYRGTNFEFPVQSAYWHWLPTLQEDSKEAWGTDIPDIAAGWHELKSEVQGLKSCGTRLPPIPDTPKKPKPKPKEKVRSYGFDLFVVNFKMSMDGGFKIGFDLGVIKGGYERLAGTDGHKFEIGSGPIEFSYTTQDAPRPGGDSSKVSVTVGTNFLSWVPGGGRAAAKIADQFFSFGAKYETTWGNKTGLSGKASVESKSKVGYSSRDVKLAPPIRQQN